MHINRRALPRTMATEVKSSLTNNLYCTVDFSQGGGGGRVAPKLNENRSYKKLIPKLWILLWNFLGRGLVFRQRLMRNGRMEGAKSRVENGDSF